MPADPWVTVADGVLVATSRRELTTSTLVVHHTEAVLIDPGWDPDELVALARSIADRGLRIVAGFATHAHHDHLLWHPALGDPPRWASPGTTAAALAHRDDLVAALGDAFPGELRELVGRVRPLTGEIPWSGPAIQLVEHDGHAPGHTALWLPEQRVLVAGDMLSDVEPPLLEGCGLPAYLAGMQRLRPFVEQARVVIPGHGHPGPDVQHRWDSDARYLDALVAGHRPDDPRATHPSADLDDRLDLDR